MQSRVVNRASGERSFHSFYQLLTGLPENDLSWYLLWCCIYSLNLEQLQLERNPDKYHYLAHSKCSKVDTIHDATDYKAVVVSLSWSMCTQIEFLECTEGPGLCGFWSQRHVEDPWWHSSLGKCCIREEEARTRCSEDHKWGWCVSAHWFRLMRLSQALQKAAAALKAPSRLLSTALVQRTIVSGVDKKASLINVVLNNEQVWIIQQIPSLFSIIEGCVLKRCFGQGSLLPIVRMVGRKDQQEDQEHNEWSGKAGHWNTGHLWLWDLSDKQLRAVLHQLLQWGTVFHPWCKLTFWN